MAALKKSKIKLHITKKYLYSNIYHIFFVSVFVLLCLIELSMVSDVFAAPATISLSIDSDTINLDIMPKIGENGTFMSSGGNVVTAWTNNATGYTLKIASTVNDNSNRYLVNTTDGNEYLTSIDSVSHANDFGVGEWGYLPSQYYSSTTGTMINNTGSDPYLLPAPDSNGDILSITTAANTTSESDSYVIALGAKVDQTTKVGLYQNSTFIVQLVANTVPYSIAYVDNVVLNMPVDVVGNADGTTVTISSNLPKRNGYTFLGWCTMRPVVNLVGSDICNGTTVAVGGTVTIDQLGGSNDYTLYAMWGPNDPVNDNIYMQNVGEWGSSLEVGQEVTAIDARDGKSYTVARLCMSTTVPATVGDCSKVNSKLWMTQNLDLIMGSRGLATLNSASSDINTDLGAAQGYSTADGVITWTPNTDYVGEITFYDGGSQSTTWYDEAFTPFHGEGGNYYVFTSGANALDTPYASRFACIAANHTDAECHHYHIGNYYNWPAAVATNSANDYTNDLYVMPNSICPSGWRLPNGLTGTNGNEAISEFNQLMLAYGITAGSTTTHPYGQASYVDSGWTSNGFIDIRKSPLYFVRAGFQYDHQLSAIRSGGYYWSSTSQSQSYAYFFGFSQSGIYPSGQIFQADGASIRCIER